MLKPFMNGKEVRWNDKELQLKWVRPELPEIEMWVAGYVALTPTTVEDDR